MVQYFWPRERDPRSAPWTRVPKPPCAPHGFYGANPTRSQRTPVPPKVTPIGALFPGPGGTSKEVQRKVGFQVWAKQNFINLISPHWGRASSSNLVGPLWILFLPACTQMELSQTALDHGNSLPGRAFGNCLLPFGRKAHRILPHFEFKGCSVHPRV